MDGNISTFRMDERAFGMSENRSGTIYMVSEPSVGRVPFAGKSECWGYPPAPSLWPHCSWREYLGLKKERKKKIVMEKSAKIFTVALDKIVTSITTGYRFHTKPSSHLYNLTFPVKIS